MEKPFVEACFSPAIFSRHNCSGVNVVVIDIFRASSAICAAFENGAGMIIPVREVEEARQYKEKGFLVAAERDGIVLDFADFGNSPFNFTPERIKDRTIAYSTTNGTKIIEMTSGSHTTAIGSFLNISALVSWLISERRDVLLFCAGWKDKFNLEDTVCAGAIASRLLESGEFRTICDSVHAAIDLWKLAEPDPLKYIQKAAHRSRLRDKGLDDCIEFCLKPDFTEIIPVVKDGNLVPFKP